MTEDKMNELFDRAFERIHRNPWIIIPGYKPTLWQRLKLYLDKKFYP